MALKSKDIADKTKNVLAGAGLAGRRERGRLKLGSFRLSPHDWAVMAEHFDRKGLTTSAGLRMVIREYMAREGLI